MWKLFSTKNTKTENNYKVSTRKSCSLTDLDPGRGMNKWQTAVHAGLLNLSTPPEENAMITISITNFQKGKFYPLSTALDFYSRLQCSPTEEYYTRDSILQVGYPSVL